MSDSQFANKKSEITNEMKMIQERLALSAKHTEELSRRFFELQGQLQLIGELEAPKKEGKAPTEVVK